MNPTAVAPKHEAHHRLAEPTVGVRLANRHQQPQPTEHPGGERIERIRDPERAGGRSVRPEHLHHHAHRQVERRERQGIAGSPAEEGSRSHGALAARFLRLGSSFFTRACSGDLGESRWKLTYSS